VTKVRTNQQVQILPAHGWLALFATPNPPHYHIEPLVCWHLDADGGYGIVTDGAALVPAPEYSNGKCVFQRYLHYPTYDEQQQREFVHEVVQVGRALAQEDEPDEASP